jgi:hypothetical protein
MNDLDPVTEYIAILDDIERRGVNEMGWQPIETAPDGSEDFFLVCGVYDERRMFVVRGDILHRARHPQQPEHLSLHWLTHWRPLPPLPEK